MTLKSTSQSSDLDLIQTLESTAQEPNLKIQSPGAQRPVLPTWVLTEEMKFAFCQILGQDESRARAGQTALMTVPHGYNLRHLLQFEARAGACLFQLLTPASLHSYQGRGHCTISLVSAYTIPFHGHGGKGWKFGRAYNCSQLGEGVDLAINTQKAAKRLQLWPRGCGLLGLGLGVG